MWQRGFLIMVCGLVALGCGRCEKSVMTDGRMVVPDITQRRAQFVETFLTAQVSHLSDGDREALSHLVAAAREVDEIFRVQAWEGNPALAVEISSHNGRDVEAVQDYYRIMNGPWDRLVDFEPFLGKKID